MKQFYSVKMYLDQIVKYFIQHNVTYECYFFLSALIVPFC